MNGAMSDPKAGTASAAGGGGWMGRIDRLYGVSAIPRGRSGAPGMGGRVTSTCAEYASVRSKIIQATRCSGNTGCRICPRELSHCSALLRSTLPLHESLRAQNPQLKASGVDA
jgi:hypothetical protein